MPRNKVNDISMQYYVLLHTIKYTIPCIRHHITPYYTIPYHKTQYHTIQYHNIPHYHTTPYHTIPYHTILNHTTPYYIIPYHTSCHTLPYHTVYHTTPYYSSVTIPCTVFFTLNDIGTKSRNKAHPKSNTPSRIELETTGLTPFPFNRIRIDERGE